ncbi:MAG: hypothetical protein FWE95_08930 [Planctomycetaceae bacterium]|nr:hypothetical protein [Planctomycetaceae bacterium]
MMKKVFTTLSVFAIMVALTLSAAAQQWWQAGNIADATKVSGTLNDKSSPVYRTNSSGDKIPSNSHSAAFPGIYINWVGNGNNAKCYAQIQSHVFDRFEDEVFWITVQFSGNYFDFELAKADGLSLGNGVYAFEFNTEVTYIHNNGKPKTEKFAGNNVNQFFIGGFYNDAFILVEKVWIDPDFNANDDTVAFTNGFGLGWNTVDVASWDSTGVSFSEITTGLVGYEFASASLYAACSCDDADCDGWEFVRNFNGNNASFNIIGDGTYKVVFVNKPIYYTVNYWNTNEFYCFSYEYERVTGRWHTEQVRHGYAAVGRQTGTPPRAFNPSLTGYAFNGWVYGGPNDVCDDITWCDLGFVTCDVNVYATWAFYNNGNNNESVWRIPNVNSWQPYKWGDMFKAGYGNQAGNGKNIGIAEAKFGSFTNDGYDGIIAFEDMDFFEKYESVTFTFYSGQGANAGPVAVIKFTSLYDWECLIGSAKELNTGNTCAVCYPFDCADLGRVCHSFDFAASGTAVAISDLVIRYTKDQE